MPTLLGQAWLRPVGIEPGGRARQIESDRNLIIDIVKIDETSTLHIEEQATANALGETRPPLPKIVKLFSPRQLRHSTSEVDAL